MTFWHYHWALIRARELELTTRERFAFAHMGARASAAGIVASSIESLAADVGLDRRDFGRAVRKLWTLGALYAAGKTSGGRRATVYRLVPEDEARAAVEADRARQPGQGAPDQPAQPGQGAPDPGQPGQGAPDQPGQGAPDQIEPSPGEPTYKPRGRWESSTGARRPGSGGQPGQGAPQPGQGAPQNNLTILTHESVLPIGRDGIAPPSLARELAANDPRRNRWFARRRATP
jgi:hypothetical protein